MLDEELKRAELFIQRYLDYFVFLRGLPDESKVYDDHGGIPRLVRWISGMVLSSNSC